MAKKNRLFLLLLILWVSNSVPVMAQDSETLIITEITEIKKTSAEVQPEKKAFSFLVGERTKADTPHTGSSQAINVSLGLMFILLLIFSMAWFMRKMGYSQQAAQGHLKILATLNLGQKEKIALIQVGQQQLVVGITANQINTLHVLDEALDVASTEADPPSGFAQKLSESLTQFKKG